MFYDIFQNIFYPKGQRSVWFLTKLSFFLDFEAILSQKNYETLSNFSIIRAFSAQTVLKRGSSDSKGHLRGALDSR